MNSRSLDDLKLRSMCWKLNVVYMSRGASTMLPMPKLQEDSERDFPSAHIAVSTLDNCGKVADRSALRYLGWRSGQHITFVVVEGMIKITEALHGRNAIAKHGYLRIPSDMRICARLDQQDRLFLIAIREYRLLLICPSSWAFAAIRPSIPLVWRQR